MSLTIKGATSGGVDIVAPASGSDVTLTLPSTTGTVLLTNGDGSSLTGVGVDGIVSTANATAITIDSSENVGIGSSLPIQKLEIGGTYSAGSQGPNIIFKGDSYPSMQILNYSHDDISINFDAWYDGTWKSGDAGSNFSIYKRSDALVFASASGVSVGSAVSFTDRLKIDSAGNMGLGGTPNAWSGFTPVLQIGDTGTIAKWPGANNNFLIGNNLWYSSGWKRIQAGKVTMIDQSSGQILLKVASDSAGGSGVDSAITFTDAVVISNHSNIGMIRDQSSGVAFNGTGGASPGVLQLSYTGAQPKLWIKSSSGSGTETEIQFNRSSSSTVGTITTSPSSTAYNTSSDYRLKENLVPITDSIERVKALKPYRFNFIVDPDVTVDGFVAHEVAESSCPEAISGEKDEMKDYEVTPAVLDDDGVEIEPAVMESRISPQSIDQSKLVPLLTAALQDAIKRIEILENA